MINETFEDKEQGNPGEFGDYKHLVKRKNKPGERVAIYVGLGVCMVVFVFVLISMLIRIWDKKTRTPSTSVEQSRVLEKTSVRIGSDKVVRGIFLKEEGGVLSVDVDGDARQYQLTDRITLRCSMQNDLDFSDQYYIEDISDVELVEPSELNEKLPAGATIVVFSEYVNNELKAYSVTLGDRCPISYTD